MANYMVIAQLPSFDLPVNLCDNECNGLRQVENFAGKQFIGWFFSVVLMNKKYVKKGHFVGVGG